MVVKPKAEGNLTEGPKDPNIIKLYRDKRRALKLDQEVVTFKGLLRHLVTLTKHPNSSEFQTWKFW